VAPPITRKASRERKRLEKFPKLIVQKLRPLTFPARQNFSAACEEIDRRDPIFSSAAGVSESLGDAAGDETFSAVPRGVQAVSALGEAYALTHALYSMSLSL
jgi:hypothetical protein